MSQRSATALALLLGLGTVAPAQAGDWPQFRGPNALGRVDTAKLPERIGPDENVIWKVELPPGHSSPVVVGDRIYVTAVRDKAKLVTIALNRATGAPLWERESPYRALEKIHTIGSHAQSSPVADREGVAVFFGSSGLTCYDREGKELWNKPFGPFPNDFGAGSSPILCAGRIILNQDHDNNSALMVFDKRTGALVWRADRSEFPRGYATPVIWEVEGRKQIVIAGTLRAVGYDFETGKEIWTVRGLARIANMTPVVGADNVLYLAAWAPGADPGERIVAAPFAEMIEKHDKNKNGTLEDDELPPGELKNRFTQIDRDKDNRISHAEYENMRRIFETAENAFIAIKPGGRGDVTASHVLWSHKKQLPYIPSPLYYDGLLYMVKNGGIVSCLDAQTGQPVKDAERVFGAANFYASPVGGDGKIYFVSERGELSVISARRDWTQLSRARFGEAVYATPAIVDGRIYLRTEKHLYCFGLK